MNDYYFYQTPADFSDLWLRSDGEFLTGVCFEQDENLFGTVSYNDRALHFNRSADFSSVFKETVTWLDIYFQGKDPGRLPKFKIDQLTPFRREVIEILLTIPFGETVTYGEIAKEIAKAHGIKKMSAQAVGGAVGWNPICILIPCHRVIGSNGALTGYHGGMYNKVGLLKLEGHRF